MHCHEYEIFPVSPVVAVIAAAQEDLHFLCQELLGARESSTVRPPWVLGNVLRVKRVSGTSQGEKRALRMYFHCIPLFSRLIVLYTDRGGVVYCELLYYRAVYPVYRSLEPYKYHT